MNSLLIKPSKPSPNGPPILAPMSEPSPPAPSPWGDWARVRCERLVVTPEVAYEILTDRNPRNRPIAKRDLAYIKSELEGGRWAVNGATLVFDRDGNLIDGQHRLLACFEAGIPIETYVLFGADPSAFTTIDRGRSRKPGDDLHVLGEKNTSNLAATLALVYLEEQDRLDQIGVVPPFPVLRATLERHPDVRDYCRLIAGNRAIRKVMHPRIASYCYYAFWRKDSAAAYTFFDDLTHGAGLARTDAVLLLRNKLIEAKASPKVDMKPVEALALTIKAWNFRRAGTPVTYLRWANTGEHPEPFPRIR